MRAASAGLGRRDAAARVADLVEEAASRPRPAGVAVTGRTATGRATTGRAASGRAASGDVAAAPGPDAATPQELAP
jgi:hypothetical protein